MSRYALLVAMTVLLGSILVGPATASAATTCSGGSCWAPSADFPNVTGGYGVVAGTANVPIYDYVDGKWVNLPGHNLAPGTAVWVAPFAGRWRWVYTSHLAWCAIDANNLWLRW